MESAPRTVALVVAAGRGTRFGGEIPKQYRRVAGMAVLRHAVLRLLAHEAVDAAQVVIHPDDQALYAEAVAGLALPPPVAGGASRQESVRNGLEHLAARPPELVLVHDAARPFVSPALVGRVRAALDGAAGAVPALAVADTLKRADGTGRIAATVDRSNLWRAQTPQGFRFAALLAAHRRLAAAGAMVTDDAAALEEAGGSVALVAGDEDNRKITTAEDLAWAERRFAEASTETRVGTGYDVHAFGPGDHVWLAGVRVPHDGGLVGHSDADVALHALTDGVLGAIGAGDIGLHFPPSDPRWAGAASAGFLAHARDLVAARGGVVVHVDLTIVCERPKIGPHRTQMVGAVAGILGLSPDRVSVKATTTEGLGFTGRREGIAAHAAVTVRLPG